MSTHQTVLFFGSQRIVFLFYYIANIPVNTDYQHLRIVYSRWKSTDFHLNTNDIMNDAVHSVGAVHALHYKISDRMMT